MFQHFKSVPKHSPYFVFQNGQIVAWWVKGTYLQYGLITTYDWPGSTSGDYDYIWVTLPGGGKTGNYNQDQPGTWTLQASSVPLPPALLLLAPGLAGLAALRRKYIG